MSSLSLHYQLSVRYTVTNVWRKERLGKAVQHMLTFLCDWWASGAATNFASWGLVQVLLPGSHTVICCEKITACFLLHRVIETDQIEVLSALQSKQHHINKAVSTKVWFWRRHFLLALSSPPFQAPISLTPQVPKKIKRNTFRLRTED